MAGTAYLARSLAATWTSVQAVNAAYPVANLSDGRQGTICRLNVAGPAWTLTADLGSAKAVNTIAVANHNLPAGTTAEVRKSSDNFVVNDVQVMAPTTGFAGMTAALTFASATERYWRLVLTFPSTLVEIGEIFLGVRVDLSRNFQWEYGQDHEATTILHRAQSGALWLYTYGKRRRGFDLTWSDLSDAARDELITMFDAVVGRIFLFVLLAQNSNPTAIADQEAALVALADPRFSMRRYVTDLNVDGRVPLLEDGRGLS